MSHFFQHNVRVHACFCPSVCVCVCVPWAHQQLPTELRPVHEDVELNPANCNFLLLCLLRMGIFGVTL